MSVVESSLNVKDVLRFRQAPVSQKGVEIEALLSNLKKLQQVKLVLKEDVKEALVERSALHNEDNALTPEVLKLQRILNEKEEHFRSLQFKSVDLEKESQKQFELRQQKEDLVQQYNCRIQETKLRHRKIRMAFENQLQQLIEQHRNLYTMFTPERLPTEVQSAGYTTEHLLKAEKQKMEQLAKLQVELSNVQNTNMLLDLVTEMNDESFCHVSHN